MSLITTNNTQFQEMTLDGYHWGRAVNLLKAEGILQAIETMRNV